jgi:peptidoglycan/xylan/chitin deacetylase (PgdA/CDA1 family)
MGSRMGRSVYEGVLGTLAGSVVGARCTEKVAALTFDDGPDPRSTPSVLAVLERLGVTATFFLVGRNVRAYPDHAARVVGAGHSIGNHSWSHPEALGDDGPIRAVQELLLCQRAIRDAVGVCPRLLRPPHGRQTVAAYLIARAMRLSVVHWSAEGHDWDGTAATEIVRRVRATVAPGSIVLLHDALELLPPQGYWNSRTDPRCDRAPTIEALSQLVEGLRCDGYRFCTVPELLRLGPVVRAPRFGSVRRSGASAPAEKAGSR